MKIKHIHRSDHINKRNAVFYISFTKNCEACHMKFYCGTSDFDCEKYMIAVSTPALKKLGHTTSNNGPHQVVIRALERHVYKNSKEIQKYREELLGYAD